MNKLVEHVACCLGETVTGNATQFVMERLAEAAKSDLRFFTAEVSASKLHAAVDGARAMSFDGLVFLQDVALKSGLPFETFSESVLKSGFVNVAKRIRSSWIADNIDGASMVALLKSYSVDGPILVYAQSAIAELIRLAAPELAERLVAIQVDDADKPLPATSSDQPQDHSVASETIQRLSRHTLRDQPRDSKVFITDRILSNLDASLLRSSLPENTLAIDLAARSDDPNREMFSELKWVSQQELQSVRLCAMFEFLTGKPADPKSVRDILDEYSSW